jgi:hypothetical protein
MGGPEVDADEGPRPTEMRLVQRTLLSWARRGGGLKMRRAPTSRVGPTGRDSAASAVGTHLILIQMLNRGFLGGQLL